MTNAVYRRKSLLETYSFRGLGSSWWEACQQVASRYWTGTVVENPFLIHKHEEELGVRERLTLGIAWACEPQKPALSDTPLQQGYIS